MARRRATISDIARTVGVSKAAVSFALNGKPGVSEELRARVQEVAADLKYQPSSAAIALGRSRVDVIGMVINRSAEALGAETFFTELMAGIQAGLAGRHVGLQIQLVSSVAEEIEVYSSWQAAHRVDGVVVVDPLREDPRIALLADVGMPAVQVGSHPSTVPEVPSVWIDDRVVATSLFTSLAGLGHTHIVHVAGPATFEHTELRAAALRECARTLSLEAAETVPTDFSPEESADVTRRMIASTNRPTALVYDNDVMAVTGLGVLEQAGVSVPGEVSVASFDDSPIARLSRPAVTAVTRDTAALGELAAVTLMQCVEGSGPVPSVGAPPSKISLRDTTGPAPR